MLKTCTQVIQDNYKIIQRMYNKRNKWHGSRFLFIIGMLLLPFCLRSSQEAWKTDLEPEVVQQISAEERTIEAIEIPKVPVPKKPEIPLKMFDLEMADDCLLISNVDTTVFEPYFFPPPPEFKFAKTEPQRAPPEEMISQVSSILKETYNRPVAPWCCNVINGIFSSFSLPLGDLLRKNHQSECRNLIDGLSIGFSYCYPLKEIKTSASGYMRAGEQDRNMTLSTSISYNPLSYWFGSVSFYSYLHPELKASWSPDFSYSFGYNDWHPYTLSLVYANYSGNRLFPDTDKGEIRTRFVEGTWSLGWKFPQPEFLQRLFLIHPGGSFSHSIGLNLSPEYLDLKTLNKKKWKKTFLFSTRYVIYGSWYCNMTAFWYIDTESQQPWNPDFTYGFGYFDWHPGTISVQYNNYSGNRFPGRKPEKGTGRFTDGAVCISYGWSF